MGSKNAGTLHTFWRMQYQVMTLATGAEKHKFQLHYIYRTFSRKLYWNNCKIVKQLRFENGHWHMLGRTFYPRIHISWHSLACKIITHTKSTVTTFRFEAINFNVNEELKLNSFTCDVKRIWTRIKRTSCKDGLYMSHIKKWTVLGKLLLCKLVPNLIRQSLPEQYLKWTIQTQTSSWKKK